MAWIDGATVASLTVPHMLYAFIWFLPGYWRQAFPKPVKAFQVAATLGKGVRVWFVLQMELVLGNAEILNNIRTHHICVSSSQHIQLLPEFVLLLTKHHLHLVFR